jgi:membrane fusion protein, multidrug efflux system
MRAVRLAFAAVVVAAAGVSGFQLTGAALDGAGAPQAQGSRGMEGPLAVELAEVSERGFEEEVRAVGSTRSLRHLEVYTLADGRVTEIAFDPGEPVEEGDVLLRLDDGAERAALKAAEATLAETQAAAARQRQLADTPATSPALLLAAEAALLRAQAEVQEARDLLAKRTLTAPFSGVVGLTDLEIGSRVDSATLVTTLDDLSAVEVAFSVPERFLSLLEPGLPVTLATIAFPDRSFAGEIARLDTNVDPDTRSLALRAVVPNPERELRGGMFMDVRLSVGERTAPAVPELALVAEGDRTFVWAVVDAKAARRAVVTGKSRDGFVEIVDGLSPEDRVIVSDLHRVADGRAVVAEDEGGPGEPGSVTVGSAT